MDIEETFQLLSDKKSPVAYEALKALQELSGESNCVYPYMDRFAEMLGSDNSYVRTRGLTLIACNARWDTDNKIDEIIDEYLRHITDPKPVTARQCIKLLPELARYKPELREDIVSALLRADVSVYAGSMRPLVSGDIQKAIGDIRAL